MEHWAKKLFQKNHPKTCSKHVWTLLWMLLGLFGFWIFLKTRPFMEHWAKNFFEKIASKHVQNTFGYFWKRLWALLEFWKFFDLFAIFRKPDPPWNTGQFFFEKTSTKHVQNKFGQFWEQFWAFLQFWIFFDFFENFRWLHGTLGKKTFSRKSPQNTFGHLDTFLDIFGTLKLFWFFSLFFSEPLPQNLSLENWTQNFQVRKTEIMCLSSGIWTHNFKCRTSEVELRILTVARMQRECLLSIVS